jgi:hypothetical protein
MIVSHQGETGQQFPLGHDRPCADIAIIRRPVIRAGAGGCVRALHRCDRRARQVCLTAFMKSYDFAGVLWHLWRALLAQP